MNINDDQEIIWDWIPLVSIGPIKFGQDPKLLIQRYSLIICDADEEEIAYEFPDETTRVYVVDGKVDSVGCYDQFYYKGNIMVGMHLSEVLNILGPPDEIDKFYGDSRPLEYDNYGLQLWITANNTVHSAIVSGPRE